MRLVPLLFLATGCEMFVLPGEETRMVPVGPPIEATRAPLPESVDVSRVPQLKCIDPDGEPVSFELVALDDGKVAVPGARVGWFNWHADRWEPVGRTDHRGVVEVELPYPSKVAFLDGVHADSVCERSGQLPRTVIHRISSRPVSLEVEVIGPDGTSLDEDLAVGARLQKLSDEIGDWLTVGPAYPLVPDGTSELLLTAGKRYQLATSHPRWAVECVGLASRGDCAEPVDSDAADHFSLPEAVSPSDTIVVRLGDHGAASGWAVSIETGRPIQGAKANLMGGWPRWSDETGHWRMPLRLTSERTFKVQVPGHTTEAVGSGLLTDKDLQSTPSMTFHEQVRWVHLDNFDIRRDAFPFCQDDVQKKSMRSKAPSIRGGILIACPVDRDTQITFLDRPQSQPLDRFTTHLSGPYPAK